MNTVIDLDPCVYLLDGQDKARVRGYKCLCDGTLAPTTLTSNGTELGTNYALSSGYNTSSGPCEPCPPGCRGILCLGGEVCPDPEPLLPNAGLRGPLVVITACAMLGAGLLLGWTWRYRKHKVLRAASPGLLFLSVGGSLLLYSETVVAALAFSDVTCMVRPWLRHLGFTLVYGSILLKMWRISVIMRVFKARMFRIKDRQLYRNLSYLLLLCGLFLGTWTLADPCRPDWTRGAELSGCQLQAWEFVTIAGECLMLAWGAYLCVESRKAPALYNEAQPISYALLCEGCWQIFMIISRLLLYRHPDPDVSFIVHFLRTHLTITPLMVLLYGPKLWTMFSKTREVQGTITDVYGPSRIHRLSLIINDRGAIKAIYCVPCGPLVHADPGEHYMTSHEARQHLKEDEYSRSEVDALIELVAKLKAEKDLHKAQIQRFLHLLKTKHTSSDLSASLVLEEPSEDEVEATCPESHGFNVIIDETVSPHGDGPIATLRPRTHVTTPGSRSERASTSTTFVSSCDDVSVGDVLQNDDNKDFLLDAISGPGCAPAPTPCHTCSTPRTGISQYALNVLRRQLARNHVLEREYMVVREHDVFCDSEVFPKLIQSREIRHNNNRNQLTLPLLQTVYDDVCDAPLPPSKPCQPALAEEAPTAVDSDDVITSGAPSADNGQLSGKKANDKMNFIMYI